jgi:hypothetical protein
MNLADPLSFEKHFDPWRRGTLANTFLKAARGPRHRGQEPSVGQVIADTLEDCRRHLFWDEKSFKAATDPESRDELGEICDFWRGLIQELENPDDELYAYVQLRIDWDKLPGNEQVNIRRRSKVGNVVPMEMKQASEAQTKYLRALGYKGPEPATMAEAATLINQFKLARGGRR